MKIDEKAEIHAFNEWFVEHYRKTGFIWSKQEALDVWLARAAQPVRVSREAVYLFAKENNVTHLAIEFGALLGALGIEVTP